jgi:hypothetical protein
VLPETVVDAAVAFLPEVWAVPFDKEIVVSVEESAQDGQAWQVMMWWPLLLEDWVLLGDEVTEATCATSSSTDPAT